MKSDIWKIGAVTIIVVLSTVILILIRERNAMDVRAAKLEHDLGEARQHLRTAKAEEVKPARGPESLEARLEPVVAAAPLPQNLPIGEPIKVEEWYKLLETEARAKIDPFFGAFFRQRNLDRATVERLKDIIVAGTSRVEDIRVSVRQIEAESGAPLSRDSIRQLYKQSLDESLQQTKELLGEDGYNAYMQYTKTARLREVTNNMASRLYETSTPLTAAQSDQIVEILAASGSNGLAAGIEQVDWNLAMPRLEAVLPVEQLRVISDLRAQSEAAQKKQKVLAPYGGK